MPFNQIIVFGAGAIGSVFGAMLSKKNSVLLVGNKEHVNAINKTGLRLILEDGEKIFNLKAKEKLGEIKENTLVLLTVKAYQLQTAVEQLSSIVKKDTIVACLQNGLGSKEIAEKKLHCEVIAGFTYTAAAVLEPGTVNVSGIDETFFEQEKGEKIAKLFNDAELPALAPKNFKQKQWEKLVLNCIANAPAAILGFEAKKICSPEMEPLLESIFNECKMVGAREGVRLEKGFFRETINQLCKSEHKPSMLQDVLSKSKTEIDFLNGKIVEFGKRHAIATPCNQSVVSLVKAIEKSY